MKALFVFFWISGITSMVSCACPEVVNASALPEMYKRRGKVIIVEEEPGVSSSEQSTPSAFPQTRRLEDPYPPFRKNVPEPASSAEQTQERVSASVSSPPRTLTVNPWEPPLPQKSSSDILRRRRPQEDFTRVVNELQNNGSFWLQLSDPQLKEMVMYYFIGEFKEENVTMSKPPSHYVLLIDDLTRQSPDLLSQPFKQVLQLVAIIEYDFDNGMDKDEMARRILGEQGFHSNRARLGLE